MGKIAHVGLLAAFVLPAHAAFADDSELWVGTLPEHPILCANGNSQNADDFHHALQSFAEPLRGKINSVGYPFVRELSLRPLDSQGSESRKAELTWRVCAPVPSGAAEVPGFQIESIPSQQIAAALCKSPAASCAQRVLTLLKISNESPRFVTLRSAPIPEHRMPPSVPVEEARRRALEDLLSTEVVRVTSMLPAPLEGSPPVVPDGHFLRKSALRPLYVQNAPLVADTSTSNEGLVVVIPISREEAQALAP